MKYLRSFLHFCSPYNGGIVLYFILSYYLAYFSARISLMKFARRVMVITVGDAAAVLSITLRDDLNARCCFLNYFSVISCEVNCVILRFITSHLTKLARLH